MQTPKKKHNAQLKFQPNFEEIDHKLSCGWYVEIEGSGQRKRYLRSIRTEQTTWGLYLNPILNNYPEKLFH